MRCRCTWLTPASMEAPCSKANRTRCSKMRAISASSPVKSAAYAAWTQHSRPQAFSVNKNVKGRVRVVGIRMPICPETFFGPLPRGSPVGGDIHPLCLGYGLVRSGNGAAVSRCGGRAALVGPPVRRCAAVALPSCPCWSPCVHIIAFFAQAKANPMFMGTSCISGGQMKRATDRRAVSLMDAFSLYSK